VCLYGSKSCLIVGLFIRDCLHTDACLSGEIIYPVELTIHTPPRGVEKGENSCYLLYEAFLLLVAPVVFCTDAQGKEMCECVCVFRTSTA
jgi:hypothetical protein